MSDWDEVLEEKDRNLNSFFRSLSNMWDLLGSSRRLIVKAVVMIFIIEILNIGFPYLLKLIFDQLPEIIGGKTISTGIIILVGALLIIKIASLTLKHFVAEKYFLKGIIKLENACPVLAQKKLLELSLNYHDKENTGKKISKIEKGCEKMVMIVMEVYWGIVPALFYLIINVVVALVIDWKLGLLFVIPFFPAMYIHYHMHNKFEGIWEAWEKKKEQAVGYFCQSIINVKTVQNFVQEKKEISNVEAIRSGMHDMDVEASIRMQRYFFVSGLILHLFYFATIALGFVFVAKGMSSIGTVVYMIATGNVTIFSIGDIMGNYARVMRKTVAVNRMKELMEQEPDIIDKGVSIVPKNYKGEFSFNDVTFTYPGKDNPVLKNFSMEIKSNRMVALVGKSGEGKTTAVRLLSRMYDVSSGKITIDGHDIRDFDLKWIRRLFAIVQQDVDIFDATLLENIRYPYPDASESQVVEALKASHLYDTLQNRERFPDGIKTQVGERGIRLSGGETQRVGIARAYIALLNGARVLILDEATSNLDSEAEKAIQKMIGKVREKLNISIIAIAHRLSTIQRADMIYVIDNGHVAEAGDHNRLVQKNGLYAHLVELQKLGDLRE
ncbi:ABC transporter ATP-binding protein [Candidatus Kuenenbacteria bacterium]|nr:ABC transporter ATP-binding protein [Candidatus Kuenenbacteria bacterium]